MSISTTQKEPEGIIREKVIKSASIKRVFEKVITLFNSDPTNFLIIFCIFITAIGELSGRSLSWKWFLLLAVITAIFFIDKFELIKREKNVIIKEADSNLPKEI